MKFDDVEVGKVYYYGGTNWRTHHDGLARLKKAKVIKKGRFREVRGQCGTVYEPSGTAPKGLVVEVKKSWPRDTVETEEIILTSAQIRMPESEFIELKKMKDADDKKHQDQFAAIEAQREKLRMRIIKSVVKKSLPFPWTSSLSKSGEGSWKRQWGSHDDDQIRIDMVIRVKDLTPEMQELCAELGAIKNPAC